MKVYDYIEGHRLPLNLRVHIVTKNGTKTVFFEAPLFVNKMYQHSPQYSSNYPDEKILQEVFPVLMQKYGLQLVTRLEVAP